MSASIVVELLFLESLFFETNCPLFDVGDKDDDNDDINNDDDRDSDDDDDRDDDDPPYDNFYDRRQT